MYPLTYFKNQLIKTDAGGIKYSYGGGATHSHAGASFTTYEAFEAIPNRMLGNEDSVCDALIVFTRPISGACFCYHPVKGERLDLSLLDINAI